MEKALFYWAGFGNHYSQQNFGKRKCSPKQGRKAEMATLESLPYFSSRQLKALTYTVFFVSNTRFEVLSLGFSKNQATRKQLLSLRLKNPKQQLPFKMQYFSNLVPTSAES